MSIQDLELLANKMSANSVSIGDWETLVHYAMGCEIVVELGTNIGSTSIVLSHIAKFVHTVDVFENVDLIEDETQREMYRNHWKSNQHTFNNIQRKFSTYPNIFCYQNLSYEAAKNFNDNSVDLIFIDADHSYEGVKKDFQAWFSKIKIGGMFAFHDVGPGCPVFDFYNNELVHDQRISVMKNVATGPCWTKVFVRLV